MRNKINVETVIALRREDKTIDEIVAITGFSRSGVYHQIRKAQANGTIKVAPKDEQHQDLPKIMHMRETGMTIYEIADELGCSPGAVHYRILNVGDTEETKARQATKRATAVKYAAPAGRLIRDENNRRKRLAAFEHGQKNNNLNAEDYFVAGLYFGEGSKTNRFRITNANPDAIKMSVSFLSRWGVPMDSLQIYVQTHQDTDSDVNIHRFWKDVSGVSDVRVYRKPSIATKTKRRLRYGVATLVVKGRYAWMSFEWVYGIMSRFVTVQRKGFKGDEKPHWQRTGP
jgi:DNA-binding CsgD family transcriptional regulator